jgi:hypothetical protein
LSDRPDKYKVFGNDETSAILTTRGSGYEKGHSLDGEAKPLEGKVQRILYRSAQGLSAATEVDDETYGRVFPNS